jgi:hypothetical protein
MSNEEDEQKSKLDVAQNEFLFWLENRPVPQDWFDGGIENPAIGQIARICHRAINRIVLMPEIIATSFSRGATHALSYQAARRLMPDPYDQPKNLPVVIVRTADEAKEFEKKVREFDSLIEKIGRGEIETDPEQLTFGFASALPYSIIRDELKDQVEMLMFNQIVSSWTVFETLAEDLWRTAINQCPRWLIDFNGDQHRIARLATKVPQETEIEDEETGAADVQGASLKSIALGDLCKIIFSSASSSSIHNRLGDLVVGKFKFTTLRGIRRAYGTAFSERARAASGAREAIDKSLSDDGLDVLKTLRNLIVHKDGVADEEYTKASSNLPENLRLKIGERLRPTVEIAHAAINAVIGSTRRLIAGVDEWVQIASK